MEFIFHNSFDRSCRLNYTLSQLYGIPNSRERVKSGPKQKKHEQTGKEAVHIEALDVVREVLCSQVIILKTIAKVSFETSLLRN